VEIYIQQGPNRQGPYTLEQVHDYYEQGIFKANDLAWNAKDPDWIPVVRFTRLYPRPERSEEEDAGESLGSWLVGAFKSIKLMLTLGILLLLLGGWWYYYRGYTPPNAPTSMTSAQIEAKAVALFNRMDLFHAKNEDWDSTEDMKEILMGTESRKLFPYKLTSEWEGVFKTKTKVDDKLWDIHAFGKFELLPDGTFNLEVTTHMTSPTTGNNEADTLKTNGRWIFMDGFLLLHAKQSVLLSHKDGTLKIIGLGRKEKIKLFDEESPPKHTALSLIEFE
jgi:hypothetical protein